MFYLERHCKEGWGLVYEEGGKAHKSADAAKAELKKLCKSGYINVPQTYEYRIVSERRIVYFVFSGVSATGKFMWNRAA